MGELNALEFPPLTILFKTSIFFFFFFLHLIWFTPNLGEIFFLDLDEKVIISKTIAYFDVKQMQ